MFMIVSKFKIYNISWFDILPELCKMRLAAVSVKSAFAVIGQSNMRSQIFSQRLSHTGIILKIEIRKRRILVTNR